MDDLRCAICGTRGNHSPGCSGAKPSLPKRGDARGWLLKDIADAIAALDTYAPQGLTRDAYLDQATATLIACRDALQESDYTRGRRDGMRRVVEILVVKLEEAVDKELAK